MFSGTPWVGDRDELFSDSLFSGDEFSCEDELSDG